MGVWPRAAVLVQVAQHWDGQLTLVCMAAVGAVLGWWAGLIMTPTVLDLDETGSAKTYSLQMAETCDPDVSDCVANLLLSGSSTQFTFDPDIIRWKADDWDNVKTVCLGRGVMAHLAPVLMRFSLGVWRLRR